MESISSHRVRCAALTLLLAAMAAVAEILSQREILFPETGALCIGLWMMPKAVWNVRSWQVPLYLTAAAVVGLLVNLGVPACFELRFALAFVLILLFLSLVRCNMYPAVSAAMLPVLMGTSSWIYPLSVLAISVLLAVGRRLLPHEPRTDYHPLSLMQAAGLTAALALLLAVTYALRPSVCNFLVVPPLVVTMIEFSNRRSGFRKRPWSIWLLLLSAAAIGSAAEWLLHRQLGLPMCLGTLLVSVAMLLLFRRFKPFAPAMAVALVPMLLPNGALLWFPLTTALGAGWFIFAGMLLDGWKVLGRRIKRGLS